MSSVETVKQNLLKGRAAPLCEAVDTALCEGAAASYILSDALLPAMSELGDKFSRGEIFVPELMRSAKAFNAALELLKPHMVSSGVQYAGCCVIGTVFGDKHDIGKNLVGIMLQGAGIRVVDLGSEVSAERFCDAVEQNGAELLAMSALLTTTMPRQGEVIRLLEERGLRSKVKVMVGGAPVTAEFAASIGADVYTPDAGSAAQKALELLS